MAKEKYQKRNGKYHKVLYDYTDDSGKRHYRSFTAATVSEMDYKIAQFRLEKHDRPAISADSQTLADAVSTYINTSEAVLSPSTVRSYLGILHNHIQDDALGRKDINTITSTDLQCWVSDLSASGLSAKTVSNSYGLVSATLSRCRPDFRPVVTLPKKIPVKRYTPSSDDVKAVLSAIDDPDLKAAVLLYAFAPMRRSEICALEWSDIHGCEITINKAMVEDKNGRWVVKPMPKTASSFRTVEVPQFVIDALPHSSQRVITETPSTISNHFEAAVKRAGVPYFRLHDLRHYSASIMHAIGVPDKYIEARGGWSTDGALRTVYENVIDLENKKQQKRINEYFDDVMNK